MTWYTNHWLLGIKFLSLKTLYSEKYQNTREKFIFILLCIKYKVKNIFYTTICRNLFRKVAYWHFFNNTKKKKLKEKTVFFVFNLILSITFLLIWIWFQLIKQFINQLTDVLYLTYWIDSKCSKQDNFEHTYFVLIV